MDAVIRGALMYGFIALVFRLAGKRTISEVTTFDFVLLLIVSEATQQALLGDDFSITNAAIVVTTLVAMDIGLSYMKQRVRWLDRWLEGKPLVIVKDGRLLRDRMARERIDEDDILEAARKNQGLERLDQIKLAVLEKSGGISIVPYPEKARG